MLETFITTIAVLVFIYTGLVILRLIFDDQVKFRDKLRRLALHIDEPEFRGINIIHHPLYKEVQEVPLMRMMVQPWRTSRSFYKGTKILALYDKSQRVKKG